MAHTSIKVYIGIRYQGSSVSEFCRQSESLLNSVNRDSQLPLHWVFNLYPLLNPLRENSGSAKSLRGLNDLVLELKTRVKTRGDRVWPAGFRGACNPCLFPGELQRELSWCRQNPWTPSPADLFGEKADTIFPIYPDPWSELASGAYSQQGFNYIGVPVFRELDCLSSRQNSPGYHLIQKTRAGGFLYYIPWTLSKSKSYAGSVRRILHSEDRSLLILLPLEDLEAEDSLQRVVGDLDRQLSISCSSLGQSDLKPGSDEGSAPEPRVPPWPSSASNWATGFELAATAPVWRIKNRQSQSHRRKKKKDEKVYRSILETMAGDSQTVDPKKPESRRPASTLIAEMAGLVHLAGPDFSAQFKRGRLIGLSRGKQRLGTGIPANSYFTISGQETKFRLESAFSFESEAVSRTGQTATGLRSVFRVNFPPAKRAARLSVDSYFYENQPELHIDLSLSLPEWFREFRFDEFVPLEIPLFSLQKTGIVQVQVGLTEESSYNAEIDTPLSVLRGKSFRFSESPFQCQYEGFESQSLMQLLIRNRGHRRVLYLNPFGSYQPVSPDAFNGLETEYSFSLKAE